MRDGNCTTAQQVTADLQTRIDGLGGRVSANLRRALADSADRLDTLVRDQCSPATESAPTVVTPPQGTSQQDGGNKDKTSKGNKKDKPAKKEKPQEVPPGQDGGNQTTPPGQQGGDQRPSTGSTGGTGGVSP